MKTAKATLTLIDIDEGNRLPERINTKKARKNYKIVLSCSFDFWKKQNWLNARDASDIHNGVGQNLRIRSLSKIAQEKLKRALRSETNFTSSSPPQSLRPLRRRPPPHHHHRHHTITTTPSPQPQPSPPQTHYIHE